MKKILHIIPSDEKFIKIIIRLFENNKNIKNTFIVEFNNDCKHIKLDNLFYKKSNQLLDTNFINEIKEYDILIIHYLTIGKTKLLGKIDFELIIIWASWGGDFYNINPKLKKNLLEPKTYNLKLRSKSKIKEVILKPIINAIYPRRTVYFWQKKAIKKINYIAPVIYEDFELIRKYYKSPHLKNIDFSYGNLEDDFLTGIISKYKLGDNILLGNSCSLENNHIEAIDLLFGINLVNKKIITPLSYGDVSIREDIVLYGKTKLKDSFLPLINFKDKEEYHELLTSCGFVVMNHKRQQALSNIITTMYLGAKIFLNKATPTYDYFKKLGAFVFLIDEIIEKKEKAFTPLTKDQIQKNREVLIKTRSKKVVETYIQKIAEL